MATQASRGQSGLDRLLFFLVGVIVLVAVLPFVLQVTGVPVRGPGAGGTASQASELRILAIEGTSVGADGSIGELRIAVAGTGGNDKFNLESATLVYRAGGTYTLFAARGGGEGDGQFRASASGPDANGVTLTGPGARGTFTVDLGTDDVRRIGSVAQRLRPGQRFSVTIIGSGGASVSANATVPADASGSSVPLR